MSEHTKEPWHVDRDGDVRGPDGQPAGLYRPENKPRICAAINACAGIETGYLENGAVAGFVEQASAETERADEAERLLREISEVSLGGPHVSAKAGFSAALETINTIRRKVRAFLEAKP